MLKDFIEKIGRDNLQKACNVSLDATYRWQRAGIIPGKYHALVEPLARDKGCFTLWKKIAGKK